MASSTRGDGPYGFSLVFSLTGCASTGCSPGTYGIRRWTMSLQNRLMMFPLRLPVQLHHRALDFALDDHRHHGARAFERGVDRFLFFPAGGLQHEIDHIGFATTRNQVARMTHADPQTIVLRC